MPESLVLTLVFHEYDRYGIQRAADISADPEHPEYGRHIDRDELQRRVALPEAELRLTVDWLEGYGMEVLPSPEVSPQLLFVRGTREQVTASFGEELHHWVDKDTEHKGSRLLLALPRRIAGYVQKVGGLPGDQGQMGSISRLVGLDDVGVTHLGGGPQPDEGPASGGSPGGLGGLTPRQFREIYEFPPDWDGRGETIALMMLGGRLDMEDMLRFWARHEVKAPEVYTVQVGPSAERTPHPLHVLETAMSVQWAGAMAPGARIGVYFIDPSVMGDPWSAFLLAVIADKKNCPTVASTSWLTPEREYYRLHGHGVIGGLLNQMAALGITVVTAAGDWGAFDGMPQTIRDGRLVSDAPWPHGIFPASEERVLSVGGSMITCLAPLTEVAWSGPLPPAFRKFSNLTRMAGSGGFSEEVSIPGWQRPVLRPYYPRGFTVPAVVPYGRGYPDVALMASGPAIQRIPGEPLSCVGYEACASGEWIDYAGGTSVGAPIWAAIIACANQARREAGRPGVGFVTPLLYRLKQETPECFREISEGSADVEMMAVGRDGRAATYHLPGYECRAGWDPVTGLGVPRVGNLIRGLRDFRGSAG